ncbi:MAG: hypothetical protein ACXADY_26330 [Candidatus Hodarchaeales archaeon]|jgi:hypothetical protein
MNWLDKTANFLTSCELAADNLERKLFKGQTSDEIINTWRDDFLQGYKEMKDEGKSVSPERETDRGLQDGQCGTADNGWVEIPRTVQHEYSLPPSTWER